MPSPAPRIYLDNAATSFPKPPGVYEAMLDYGQRLGASPGRGHYAESREGARLIRRCRERLNTLLNGESPDHIVFALNTSDALNLAIKGVARQWKLTRPGEPLRLVTTAMDHNSVLRPFAALAEEGAEVIHIDADPETGLIDLEALRAALTPGTTLCAANWVSNVSGTIQPIEAIGRACKTVGVPYLIDVAQGLGHLPFDARSVHADFVAFPGHKGLLGPQGTGGLYIRPGAVSLLATTREGGTGSISEEDTQPLTMPERFEAGSHNTLGIVGLSESVAWILERTPAALRAHELELIEAMLTRLAAAGCRLQGHAHQVGPLSDLRLLGPGAAEARVGTFSFVHAAVPPAELAVILEQAFGILARSGIHCAPRAHRALGTLGRAETPGFGALRLSLGPFVTLSDIHAACDALEEICREMAPGTRTPAVTLQA